LGDLLTRVEAASTTVALLSGNNESVDALQHTPIKYLIANEYSLRAAFSYAILWA
jgi:hypothetical protein